MSAGARAQAAPAIVVGSGLAGLATALFMAPEPVVLITRAPLGEGCASAWAQGGLAASVADDDDAELHLADTLAAGDGLVDPLAALAIVERGPAAVVALERLGVHFDRTATGELALGLEAAHGRRRIVHADGDGTGRAIVQALVAAVRRTPSITVREHTEVRRLLMHDGAVSGVLTVGPGGVAALAAARVVLATGGIGGLFDDTTNPRDAIGHGLALAARAGARLADLEFMQFHPTALATDQRPMPLISEAVRGEGAVLIDAAGQRIMAGVPQGDLAPRDVVARAVWGSLQRGIAVYLDARDALGSRFAARFPAIDAACRATGIDPARMPIPVRPAAHYHMGGILVDAAGCSSIPGLWACGEVASTGLHGANRLASNSLMEAAVCAERVADSLRAFDQTPRVPPRTLHDVPPAPRTERVRPIVSRHLGVVRDGPGLTGAVTDLLALAREGRSAADPAVVALMIAVAALRRTESRGAHLRSDHPARAAEAVSSRLTLDEALAEAETLTPAAPAFARYN